MPLMPDPIRSAETGWKVLQWMRRLRLYDHSSLYGGWYTQDRFTGRNYMYVTVACAPSRRLRRQRPVSPHFALAFLEVVMPGGFAMPASQSMHDVVAFETRDDESSQMMYDPLRAARMWANGRVEFLVRVPFEKDDANRVIVDLASAFRPVQQVALAVKRGDYRRLYRFRTRQRRLDWYVSLSSAITDDIRGWHPWDDLKFPGCRPRHRAANSHAAAPMQGLGARQLRSKRQSTDPTALLRPALGELVNESGWHDGNEEAVADTIAAVAGAEKPQ